MSFDLSKVCLASPSFALKTKVFVIKKTGLSGPKFLYWPLCKKMLIIFVRNLYLPTVKGSNW